MQTALVEEDLARIRLAISPRYAPPPTPWRSRAIHGGALLLWILLFARAFFGGGVFAWSAAWPAYVLYDTVLLGFVFWHTLALLRPAVAAPPGALPDATIIVAAHDEAATLPITLAAMFAQTSPAAMILIADDGSSDATAALLTGEYGPCHARHRRAQRPQPHPSHAALAAPAARRQGPRAERRLRLHRDGAGTDGGRRHPAGPGRTRRHARRLRRRPGARRRHRGADAGLRPLRLRPAAAMVPDLRIRPQLPVALRLDAGGRAAADLRRVRLLPAPAPCWRSADSTWTAWWRTTS